MIYTGATDPDASTGINGDIYINTDNGDLWQKSNGSWTSIGNIKGEDGEDGADGEDGTYLNPLKIALLQWYEANETRISYSVGSRPTSICFDGANIWVTNYGSDNVTKLDAVYGNVLGTYNVGSEPQGICFDGASIWVNNQGSNNVTRLNAADGLL
jgi:YVTN family beta-propeller protein